MTHVAYMSSASGEVSCLQQQLECEWNVKPLTGEAGAQSTETVGFWQYYCTTERALFQLGC